jgi:hypothetical protein
MEVGSKNGRSRTRTGGCSLYDLGPARGVGEADPAVGELVVLHHDRFALAVLGVTEEAIVGADRIPLEEDLAPDARAGGDAERRRHAEVGPPALAGKGPAGSE